jgi:hypothetical protein
MCFIFFPPILAREVGFVGYVPTPRGCELPQYRGESPLNMSSALNTKNFDTQGATHKRGNIRGIFR